MTDIRRYRRQMPGKRLLRLGEVVFGDTSNHGPRHKAIPVPTVATRCGAGSLTCGALPAIPTRGSARLQSVRSSTSGRPPTTPTWRRACATRCSATRWSLLGSRRRSRAGAAATRRPRSPAPAARRRRWSPRRRRRRCSQELERCLCGRDVDVALEWLHEIGVDPRCCFPELEATVDLAQEAGRQHKDVWAHTKQVVKQAVPRPVVRWAALLHDIGKVPTRTFTKDGVHFHGHAEVGARMFDKVLPPLPVRADDGAEGPLPHQAPPALEPVQRSVDRQRGAPVPPRDGGAPGRPARSVARRHHVEAAGPPPGAARQISALRTASSGCARRTRACRRCRPASATRSWSVRAAAVAADRRSQAALEEAIETRRARGAARGRVLPRVARSPVGGRRGRLRRGSAGCKENRRQATGRQATGGNRNLPFRVCAHRTAP